jgi:hypothetical protein
MPTNYRYIFFFYAAQQLARSPACDFDSHPEKKVMRGPLKKPARFSGSFCQQVAASYNKEGGIVILWKEGTNKSTWDLPFPPIPSVPSINIMLAHREGSWSNRPFRNGI